MGVFNLDADAALRQQEILQEDERVLARMGYRQELSRVLGWFSNLELCVTLVCPIMGVTGHLCRLFIVGWSYGGPVTIVWGWVIVAFFVTLIGLSMAEICSAYPTSGSLYYWAARLGGKHSLLFAWITGWLNLLGVISGVSTVDYVLTNLIAMMVLLGTGTYPTNPQLLAIFAAILVAHGAINTLGVKALRILGHVGFIWQIASMLFLIIGLPAIAPTHQSPKFVFTQWYPNMDWNGLPSYAYVFLVGLLMAQFSISGYDASPHLIEETANSQISGAWGILGSIVSAAILGFAYILTLLFSIQNVDNLLGEQALASPTGGFLPPAQIFYDACQARWGGNAGRTGALVLLTLPVVAAFMAGAAQLTSASRMLFAFSRDGSVPGSHLWHKVHPTSKAPINSVWGCVVVAFLLALPMLQSTFAFNAVTSVCTISLYASYGMPIFLRLTFGRKDFVPGPFNLGALSIPVAFLATVWVAIIVVVFVLPQVYPVDMMMNFNYAPVAFGGVLLLSLAWYFLDARRWFKGPVRQAGLGEADEEPGKV